jgi:hypothetical protein
LNKDVREESAMAQVGRSFDDLCRIVDQIPDREVTLAIGLVRKQRAGLMADRNPHRLQSVIRHMERDQLDWLDAVLCVRTQQAGRDGAWRRFAESAYREILPVCVDGSSSSAPASGARRAA